MANRQDRVVFTLFQSLSQSGQERNGKARGLRNKWQRFLTSLHTRKSGAPAGRGGDAGCCGAGGWTDRDVTELPLASLPSSGGQVAGRPAAGPRPRRQRDLRTILSSFKNQCTL